MRLSHTVLIPLLVVTTASASFAALNTADARQLELLKQGREYAIEKGLITGLVDVELIRDDILEVTLDGALVGDHTDVEGERGRILGGLAADLQKPEAFVITSATAPGFAEGVQPEKVFRDSYDVFNAKDTKGNWSLAVRNLVHYNYYLHLPTPLVPGHTYTIQVVGGAAEARAKDTTEFTFDDKTTTKAIKVNTLGYSAQSDRRYGYLGWWQGDGGAVDYSELKKFEVIDEKSGETALEGDLTLRAEGDELSGEDVYEFDLSPLKIGTYHVRIPGFANSDTFTVGGENVFETYYHTMRVFFHQRCGQELGLPHTAATKAACHTHVYENGELPEGLDRIGLQESKVRQPEKLGPRGELKEFKGGYHDAADFDTFAYHLPATGLTLIAYEFHPPAFTDSQLNIPESGNGFPDLLDEAAWGLSFYLENQLESGAIPLGRANLSDAIKQNFEKDREVFAPPHGVLPPAKNSTPQFAAIAAQFARIVKPLDEALAAKYLEAARRAFDYASTRTAKDVWEEHRNEKTKLIYDEKDERSRPSQILWAACELYAATGDAKYSDYISAHFKDGGYWSTAPQAFWSYLRMPEDQTDPQVREAFLSKMLAKNGNGAEAALRGTEEGSYRMGNGKGTQIGWGRANGLSHAENLLIAYGLTGEQKYFDAATLNYDFTSGVNPLGKTMITSMGTRYPQRPEISMFLYLDKDEAEIYGDTIRGYTVYGFGPPVKNYPGPGEDGVKAEGYEPKGWPLWRSWRDVWGDFAEIYSEFTIHQTTGPSAFDAAMIFADAVKAGELTPDQKPKFPLGALDR